MFESKENCLTPRIVSQFWIFTNLIFLTLRSASSLIPRSVSLRGVTFFTVYLGKNNIPAKPF